MASKKTMWLGLGLVIVCAAVFGFFRLNAPEVSNREAEQLIRVTSQPYVIQDGVENTTLYKKDHTFYTMLIGFASGAHSANPHFPARAISVLASILCIIAIFLWTHRRFGALAASFSGLICISSLGWMYYARTAVPDMAGVLFFTAMMFAVHNLLAGDAQKRGMWGSLVLIFFLLLLASGTRELLALAFLTIILSTALIYGEPARSPKAWLVILPFVLLSAGLAPEVFGRNSITLFLRAKTVLIAILMTIPWIGLLPFGILQARVTENKGYTWGAFFMPVISQLRAHRWFYALVTAIVLIVPQLLLDRYSRPIGNIYIAGVLRLAFLFAACALSSYLSARGNSGEKIPEEQFNMTDRFLLIWLGTAAGFILFFGLKGGIMLALIPPLGIFAGRLWAAAFNERKSETRAKKNLLYGVCGSAMLVSAVIIDMLYIINYKQVLVDTLLPYWPNAGSYLTPALMKYLDENASFAYWCLGGTWLFIVLLYFITRTKALLNTATLTVMFVGGLGYIWTVNVAPYTHSRKDLRKLTAKYAEDSANVEAPLGLYACKDDVLMAYYAGLNGKDSIILRDRKSLAAAFNTFTTIYVAIPEGLNDKRLSTKDYLVMPLMQPENAEEQKLPKLIIKRPWPPLMRRDALDDGK